MPARRILRKVVNKPLGFIGLEIRKIPQGSNEQPVEPIVVAEAPPSEVNDQVEFDLTPYQWLTKKGIKTVLDIGANTGQFAESIHQVLPHARIISFEPLKDCFEELEKNGARLGDFTAYNYALGEKDGEAPIYRSEFSPSSSLLPMAELHKKAFPFTRRGTVEKITVRRLDGLGLDFEQPSLIKLDVQGFEDMVIAGGRKTISQASVIIVETSFQTLYKGQPMFDKIYTLLRDMGFAYHGNWYQNNDVRDGSALQADAIFLATNNQKPEKLKTNAK